MKTSSLWLDVQKMWSLPLDHISVASQGSGGSNMFYLPENNTNNGTHSAVCSGVSRFHIFTLVLVFHLAGCLSAPESHQPSLWGPLRCPLAKMEEPRGMFQSSLIGFRCCGPLASPPPSPHSVSCVIGLPAPQSKRRHFSSKRESAGLRNGSSSFTVKSLLVLKIRSDLVICSLWQSIVEETSLYPIIVVCVRSLLITQNTSKLWRHHFPNNPFYIPNKDCI